MSAIAQIFRTFGPEYIDRFAYQMPREHRKVIEAILRCRTREAGVAFYECERCGEPHVVFQSNRHCPTCQHHKTRQWLETQMDRQLPGNHFMITFTVPSQIRSFMRSNQRAAYSALSSSESIKLLAKDPKHIGGDLPGFFGVLHTWGRTLDYHPHIHYVVVGGALSTKDRKWHPARNRFYVPVKALSKIFRAKFRDEMIKAGLYGLIPEQVWQISWNVNCQAVGQAHATIKYLSPYVFRVAISNSRIIKVEDGVIHFRYRRPKSSRWRVMALDAMEFIRRFLQHVLPTGFMKVRHFGFLNPNCTVETQTISTLIQMGYGFELSVPEVELEPWSPICCTKCGGPLRLHSILRPNGIVVRPG